MAYKRAYSKGKGSGRSGVKRQRTSYANKPYSRRGAMFSAGRVAYQAAKGVQRLTRMIETKESQRVGTLNIGLPHNNVYIPIDATAGGNLNPFLLNSGSGDPMSQGTGNRVGDSIAVKGLTIKCFFQNALQRSRVYYRMMFLKCAKGDVPTRAVLFKNDSNNKMMDIVNTERFTILAQKIFTIECANTAPSSTQLITGVPTAAIAAGIGTKLVTMWVPGKKFGRNGVVQYLSDSASDLKFFDYRIAIVAYDWFATDQDINNVGVINELFTKLYFKDA